MPRKKIIEELPVNPLFEQAKEQVIGIERQRLGIGTLSEKTVHAILKRYYAPDEDMHEIPIENYVADIYTGKEIIEIQTGQFNRMRDKLTTFLKEYPVTIVYPIPRQKWLIWIDEESGELSKPHKSPARGTPYQAFKELYKIKMFLKDPNLRLKFALIDMEEYRLLNGWSKDKKKGSCRYDRIPSRLAEEVSVENVRDYLQFVPYDLEEPFTSAQFAKAAHIRKPLAQTVLNILTYVECVERVGKEGNSYLYSVKEW
ncbi:MAG: hypothetical protein IJX66_11850 [Lachnospiraceae bacterium]|nr:hypothetical protein [Lachnospiraceae bacterium]